MDNKGALLPKQDLENSYKLTINFLDFHRIKIVLTRNANKLKKHPFERPFIPAQIKLLINSYKGSRNFYLSQFKNDNAQDFQTFKKNSIRDARTPQPREIFSTP